MIDPGGPLYDYGPWCADCQVSTEDLQECADNKARCDDCLEEARCGLCNVPSSLRTPMPVASYVATTLVHPPYWTDLGRTEVTSGPPRVDTERVCCECAWTTAAEFGDVSVVPL